MAQSPQHGGDGIDGCGAVELFLDVVGLIGIDQCFFLEIVGDADAHGEVPEEWAAFRPGVLRERQAEKQRIAYRVPIVASSSAGSGWSQQPSSTCLSSVWETTLSRRRAMRSLFSGMITVLSPWTRALTPRVLVR